MERCRGHLERLRPPPFCTCFPGATRSPDRDLSRATNRLGRLQRRRKEYASERENLAVYAEAQSFSLPPADTTNKLLRYEAHLDRQLYRAMDQLERLQRQRRGENVPPPLNINWGKRT
jgi:hypothetical protein